MTHRSAGQMSEPSRAALAAAPAETRRVVAPNAGARQPRRRLCLGRVARLPHHQAPLDQLDDDLGGRLVVRAPGGVARHLGSGGPVAIEGMAVLLAWLVLYHMYRERIFLRI